MEIKNYTANACRDLRNIVMNWNPAMDSQGNDRKMVRRFIEDVEQKAVHFTLPDFGKIFDDGFKGLYGEKLRLAYPYVTLEYSVTNDDRVNHATTFHSSKRVVIAQEISLKEGFERFSPDVARQLETVLKDPNYHPNGQGILI